jgi:hypothetical protein
LATTVFCNDWPVPLRDYSQYAELVDTAAAMAPDVRYGAGLIAVVSCLGWPAPVRNPIHVPQVHTSTPLLLLNALHDPRTGYEWATHVADQLGRNGRLVTYEGWGHGSYGSTPCNTATVDRYLINLALPAPGTRCPTTSPPSRWPASCSPWSTTAYATGTSAPSTRSRPRREQGST